MLRTGVPWEDLLEKRGCAVGTTKRGENTKIMAVTDAAGYNMDVLRLTVSFGNLWTIAQEQRDLF